MILKNEDKYFHYYIITELLREYNIPISISCDDIYWIIPIGIIRRAILEEVARPVVHWVMEEYIGCYWDEELEEWVKQENTGHYDLVVNSRKQD